MSLSKTEFYDIGYDAIAQLHRSSPTITRQIIFTDKLLAS